MAKGFQAEYYTLIYVCIGHSSFATGCRLLVQLHYRYCAILTCAVGMGYVKLIVG